MATFLCQRDRKIAGRKRQHAGSEEQPQEILPETAKPASARTGRRLLVWSVFIIGGLFLLGCLWLLMKAPEVALADAPESQLDCVRCHQQTLSWHDKLSSGNQACWSCHASTDLTMTRLQLANGTTIEKSETSQLCGQCHQARYGDWQEGTHGIPGTVAVIPCTACHNPHRPQVALTNITRPPPAPAHTAPPVPKDPLIIIGISVLFLTGLGIVLARRRETP